MAGLILPYKNKLPQIIRPAFIAPNATIIGDVEIGEDSSVWYQTVIRGDDGPIRIGKRVNLQDLVMVHITADKYSTTIEDDVTIGHNAVLHGCVVEYGSLIGMGAILLDGSHIGYESLVGAGALVTPRSVFPPRSLILGSPAKVVRKLTEEEVQANYASALHYVNVSTFH